MCLCKFICLRYLRSDSIFLGHLAKSSNDESRPRWERGRQTVSDFYWLKTPPAPAIALVVRSTVSRLNGSRGPGRLLARYQASIRLLCCWLQLSLFKEVRSYFRSYAVAGSLTQARLKADASRKITSTVRARLKTLYPAWSGVSPWTCQA